MSSQINSTGFWSKALQSFGGIDMHCEYLKCSTQRVPNLVTTWPFLKNHIIGKYVDDGWSAFGLHINEIRSWNSIMTWLGWDRCERIAWDICRVLFSLDRKV